MMILLLDYTLNRSFQILMFFEFSDLSHAPITH